MSCFKKKFKELLIFDKIPTGFQNHFNIPYVINA